METNENIIALTGKANIPVPLTLGEAYTIELTGEVASETKLPNHDGTQNTIFRFKPIIALIKSEHGEVIKTKDLRNNSVKFRKSCWKVWAENNVSGDFEDFYDYATSKSISLLEKISQDYEKHRNI